jgi:hypothetical protein
MSSLVSIQKKLDEALMIRGKIAYKLVVSHLYKKGKGRKV